MYTRPVVTLVENFQVNKHLTLDDADDLDEEWLMKGLGIEKKGVPRPRVRGCGPRRGGRWASLSRGGAPPGLTCRLQWSAAPLGQFGNSRYLIFSLNA